MMQTYDHAMIRVNGINLHVVQAGPSVGPLVILLHGFPEFWYGWRQQIDFLAERGFRVWAPDQRGYNLSDKPQEMAAYNLDLLAADVVGLIEASGQEKAYLVGHDWGAAVAWWTANKYPERLKKIVILNVPHLAVMRKALQSNLGQIRRSWYMFFFQIPWLAEHSIRRNNWQAFSEALQKTSNPGSFTGDDIMEYRRAWSQPGAITAMLNWYRAIFQKPPGRLTSPRISTPTLILWGRKDHVLRWQMAQESIELCDQGHLIYFEDATHWIQHDKAADVNRLMAEFFSEAG